MKTMSCSNFDSIPCTMDKLLLIFMVKHTCITLTLKCHKANDLNSTYLWNCHLGHVRKERMKELHANDFWSHLIFESFGACKSFLKRMTKIPLYMLKTWSCACLVFLCLLHYAYMTCLFTRFLCIGSMLDLNVFWICLLMLSFCFKYYFLRVHH